MIIDRSEEFKDLQLFNMLKRPTVSVYCHPDDAVYFQFLPPGKVRPSNLMQKGKPYALDQKALENFLNLRPDFEWQPSG